MAEQVEEKVIFTGDASSLQNAFNSLINDISRTREELKQYKGDKEKTAELTKKLADQEKQLVDVMKKSNNTIDASNVSYRQLNDILKDLNKTYKETADEAQRLDLAPSIKAINTELKGMDASIGNFQRNVGNYEGAITSAADSMSRSFVNLAKTLPSLADGPERFFMQLAQQLPNIVSAYKDLKAAREASDAFSAFSSEHGWLGVDGFFLSVLSVISTPSMISQEMKYPGTTRVLVWRLEEDAQQLLALCQQQGIPYDDLLDQPIKRQREKAAERLLLCQAFGHPVTLSLDQQGAPLIEGEKVNISISHTMHLVAVALNNNNVIGLDAERIDRQQVLRVRDKYLNANEQQFIKPDDLAAHVIAWTAKEAVIKAERNSAIDWTEGIRLEPFTPYTVETIIIAHYSGRRYDLTSRQLEGHYLTIAIPAIR